MISLLRQYTKWLHGQWPAGHVEKLPLVDEHGGKCDVCSYRASAAPGETMHRPRQASVKAPGSDCQGGGGSSTGAPRQRSSSW